MNRIERYRTSDKEQVYTYIIASVKRIRSYSLAKKKENEKKEQWRLGKMDICVCSSAKRKVYKRRFEK